MDQTTRQEMLAMTHVELENFLRSFQSVDEVDLNSATLEMIQFACELLGA